METLKRRLVTDFLVPKMSFFIGIGSIFNLAGSYYQYNTSKTSKEADYKAISRDWQIIGKDFQDALEDEESLDKV